MPARDTSRAADFTRRRSSNLNQWCTDRELDLKCGQGYWTTVTGRTVTPGPGSLGRDRNTTWKRAFCCLVRARQHESWPRTLYQRHPRGHSCLCIFAKIRHIDLHCKASTVQCVFNTESWILILKQSRRSRDPPIPFQVFRTPHVPRCPLLL